MLTYSRYYMDQYLTSYNYITSILNGLFCLVWPPNTYTYAKGERKVSLPCLYLTYPRHVSIGGAYECMHRDYTRTWLHT